MSDTDQSATAAEPEGGVQPLIAELRLLAGDAASFLRSEVSFQTARARVAGLGLRKVALGAVFAFVFVVFALGGLTVGLLLALTPLVTAWGATAIVVGLLLLGAAGCGLVALRAWRQMLRALTGEDGA